MDQEPVVVAVINSTPDIVDMLRLTLEHAGFVVVSAFTHDIRDGRVDVQQFMGQHQPRVVVYDVAPPYDANWHLFQHISGMPAMQGRQFVVTTTNERHVQRLAGQHRQIYEIVGKSADLGQVVQAIKEATRARPTR